MSHGRSSVAAYVAAFLLLVLAASAAFPGCPSKGSSTGGSGTPGTTDGATGGTSGGAGTGSETGTTSTTTSAQGHGSLTLTLYFPDDQAMYLHAEKRTIPWTPRPARAMVEQLIKGPTKPGLVSAIPRGTELLNIDIKKGVAYVDFSRDMVRGAPGGSAGEAMTIYSVVDSLATFPSIRKVKFLIEGRPVDTLTGHADLSEPIGPNKRLVK